MMNKINAIIVSTLFFTISSISQADVISIADPLYDVPNSAEGISRPTLGMSMSFVEQKFGQPEQKSPVVGRPPISRWSYDKFNVFFEDQTVIHSVVSH